LAGIKFGEINKLGKIRKFKTLPTAKFPPNMLISSVGKKISRQI